MSDSTSKQSSGQIRVIGSVLKRAMKDDTEALHTMFRQFVPPDEKIETARFLGIQGLWGIGTRSFGCVTNKRVAALRVGAFKEITYQDGFLEHVNSGVIYQPSKLRLYVLLLLSTVVALGVTIFSVQLISRVFSSDLPESWYFFLSLPIGGVTLLLLWLFAVKFYYRFVKCGLVWWVREGVLVYVFANRGMMIRANQLYRESMIQKERHADTFQSRY